MIRPPSDLFQFVKAVAEASFGDAWIPRLAIELGCEASEAGIHERCAGQFHDDEIEQFDRWALQILDARVDAIMDIRRAVGSRMDDRQRARTAASKAEAAKPFDLEAAKAALRDREPPMVAQFMCELLDEQFGENADAT